MSGPAGRGGLNYVEMVVRNEDGDPDNGITTAGSFITAIGLTAPNLEGIANFAVALEGSVGVTEPLDGNYSPLDLWDFGNGGLGGGGIELKAEQTGTLGEGSAPRGTHGLGSSFFQRPRRVRMSGRSPRPHGFRERRIRRRLRAHCIRHEGTDGLGGIRGCNEPYSTAVSYFTTCDAQDYTGGVLFSFTTTNRWSADYAEIVLKYQDLGPTWDDDNLSLVCRTGDEPGPEPGDNDHLCAVVPEPSTWALLLTGMVGVLGMGWLRRKQEEGGGSRA